jgi:hypothetical protein
VIGSGGAPARSARGRVIGLAACALASLASAPRVTGAQGAPVDSACAIAVVYGEDAPQRDALATVSTMHPLRVRERFAALAAADEWPGLLDSLIEASQLAFIAAGVDAQRSAVFADSVRALRRVLRELPSLPAGQRMARLTASDFSQGFNPAPLDDAGYELTTLGVTIARDEPRAVARALCWSSLSVHAVVTAVKEPLERTGVERLARLDRSWKNFREHSYSRAPWEWALTPGDRRRETPPRVQWLLAHPSAGLEVSGSRLDSLASRTSLVLELGLITYHGDWTQYSGGSVMISSGTSGPLRVGVMAHVARGVRAGYFIVGNPGLVMSVDALGWLQQTKAKVDEVVALGKARVRLKAP